MSLHHYRQSIRSSHDPLFQSCFHITLLQLNNKWVCLYSEAIQPTTSDCLALICCSGDYPGKILSNYMFLMIHVFTITSRLKHCPGLQSDPSNTRACMHAIV